MQDNASLLNSSASLFALDNTALSAVTSHRTADVLTPAEHGPKMLLSEATLSGSQIGSQISSQRDSQNASTAIVCFAPSERFSDEGALLSPAQILANRVLSEKPALNEVVERGAQLAEGASDVFSQATALTRDLTIETKKEISESAREWLQAAKNSWRAPDNTARLMLNQRTDQLADGVGELIREIDDSDRMETVRGYWDKASDAFNNFTDGLYRELGYVDASATAAETAALEKAEQRLQATLSDFRESDRFEATVQTAFGNGVDTTAAKLLIDRFVSGAIAPTIQIVESGILSGDAAFGDNTIFISKAYLQKNAANPDAIDAVLLEEAGHYFDQALNATDAAGDEGNIFARLTLGETLSAETLQQLKTEDDRTVITYNGRRIEVENFWDSISSGFDSFTSSVSDYASDTYDSVSDYASNTYDSVSDYASDTYDSVSDYASDTYDSVSDYTSNAYDTVSDYTSNTYDSVSDYASDAYDSVSNYASDTYSSVSDYASDTYDSVSDYTSNAYDTVSDYASDTYSSVSDYASDTYDSVSDYTSNAYDTASDYASDTYDSVSDYASNAYDTASTTLSDGWNSFSDAASNSWDSIETTASDTWDTVTETYDDWSEVAVDTFDDVTETATEAWTDTKETVSDFVDDVSQTATDARDTVVEFVDESADAIAQTAVEAKDATVEFVTEDAPEWIAETAIDAKDATVEFVTEDVPEWIAENETTVNRVVGGVQTVGGIGEMVAGAALVPTGAASFGAGTVAGGVVMAHGADTTWAGLKALWTGEAQETYTQQGVTAVADAIPGVETDTAESIGMWTDFGIGIAGPGAAIAKGLKGSADNVVAGSLDNFVAGSSDDVLPQVVDDGLEEVTEEFSTVFRVQGGTPPKASRAHIVLDANGNPQISKTQLNVSIGDPEHAQHFLSQRPGAEVVSFDIPKWMDDFIVEEAVPQLNYRSNPLNQGFQAPKVVDPTTPGRSYELPSVWAEWLEETAIEGSGKVTK